MSFFQMGSKRVLEVKFSVRNKFWFCVKEKFKGPKTRIEFSFDVMSMISPIKFFVKMYSEVFCVKWVRNCDVVESNLRTNLISDVAGFGFVYFNFPILTPGFQGGVMRLQLYRCNDWVFMGWKDYFIVDLFGNKRVKRSGLISYEYVEKDKSCYCSLGNYCFNNGNRRETWAVPISELTVFVIIYKKLVESRWEDFFLIKRGGQYATTCRKLERPRGKQHTVLFLF
jgi:hypothetical protein